jgi:ABC-2 type transport system permease protein
MFSLLAKYHFKMSLFSFRGGKQIWKLILLIIALLFFAFSISMFVYGIYKYATLYPVEGGNLLDNLIAVAFHGMFVLLCFSGLSLAILTVFFSKELELLLTLPIKSSTVFIFKVSEAIFKNVRISLLFLVPTLIILGVYRHSVVFYYLLIAVIILLMAAIPSSLGIILAAAVSRKIPKSRQRSLLSVMGALIGLSVWAVMIQFSGHFSSDSADFGSSSMKMAKIASLPFLKYIPSGWGYFAATSAAKGDWQTSLTYILLLAGGAIIFSYLALISTSKFYSNGVTEEVAAPKANAVVSFEIGGSPIRAHIKRDILLISRELSVAVQSLIILAFCFLFPILGRRADTEISGAISRMPFSFFAAIFATFFGAQFGSRLIPLERLGFWLNLVTPDGRWLSLASKMIVGSIFVILMISIVGTIHLILGISHSILYILYLAAFAVTGFSLGIFFGVFFADFKWELPQRMLKSGWILIFVLTIFATGAIFIGITYLAQIFISSFISPLIIVILFSLGFMTLAIAFSLMRLMTMEWNPE